MQRCGQFTPQVAKPCEVGDRLRVAVHGGIRLPAIHEAHGPSWRKIASGGEAPDGGFVVFAFGVGGAEIVVKKSTRIEFACPP
jgi:hypothetical protein